MHDLALRRAPIAPATLDIEARTVAVTAATGAAVGRFGVAPNGEWTNWVEELDLVGADLSRFRGGPVLLDHMATTDSQVGVVEEAWTERRALVARVRFGSGPRAEATLRDVRDGILTSVSVGYRVSEWAPAGISEEGWPVFRAVRWQPVELSFVPIAADPKAKVRASAADILTRTAQMEFCLMSGTMIAPNMPTPATTALDSTAAAPTAAPHAPSLGTAERQAAEPQQRAATFAELHAMQRALGLSAEWTVALQARGATLEEARVAAHAAMASAAPQRLGATTVTVLRDAGDTMMRGFVEYIAARCLARVPENEGEQFRGLRFMDALRETLTARGCAMPRGTAVDELLMRAMSTSDLPVALQGGARRVMEETFPTFRTPLLRLCQPRLMVDFREVTLMRMGAHKPLSLVAEGGEVTTAYPVEYSEKAQLRTYAANFIFTREAIVNDDLDALGAFLRSGAAAAAATERREIVALFTANSGAGPTLNDGTTWFHTSRNNVGTGGAPDTAKLAEAIKLLRTQADPNGETFVTFEPAAVVAGPAQELAVRQLLSDVTRPTAYSSAQPFRDLELVVENSFGASEKRWWVTANPATHRAITVGYLDGNDQPIVETFSEPETLGLTTRITFDVVAAVNDWRGWVTNAGQ